MSAPYLAIDVPDDDGTVLNRIDEHAVNANDATEGHVYTVEADPDHAGKKRATFKVPAVTPDDLGGIPEGTPGNLSLGLWAGHPNVLVVPSALTIPTEWRRAAKYHNLGAVAMLRVQVDTVGAGPTGTRVVVIGSLNGGLSFRLLDVAQTGPYAQGDRVRLPDFGDWFAIDPDMAVDNVLICPALMGGDGVTEGIYGHVWLDMVSAATPPDSEIPVGDLPTGGAYGTLVLNHDARSLELADGASVTTWPDLSGAGHHATPFGAAPIYKADGGGAGFPSVRFNGSTQGLGFSQPASSSFTYYLVIANAAGEGASADAFGNGSLIDGEVGGAHEDFTMTMRADGKITVGAGQGFGFNSFISTNAWSGGKHVHVMQRDGTTGTMSLVSDGTAQGSVGGWSANRTNPSVFYGRGPAVGQSAGDYLQVLCWNALHGPTERAAILALLNASWGV